MSHYFTNVFIDLKLCVPSNIMFFGWTGRHIPSDRKTIATTTVGNIFNGIRRLIIFQFSEIKKTNLLI